MRLISRHLTTGLIYARVWKLLLVAPGTIISLFWQLINLYGTLPGVLLTLCSFQLLAGVLAVIIWSGSLFTLSFQVAFLAGAGILVLMFIAWLLANIHLNRRARFELVNLHYSTRTALLLLGLLLCHRIPEVRVSPRTTFWDVHLKPTLAGNLHRIGKSRIVDGLASDYSRLWELLGTDVVVFGCSPGSFKGLLQKAGLSATQFTMIETVIPSSHARVFGLNQPFYFYIITFPESRG
jgi:hypothetical protein